MRIRAIHLILACFISAIVGYYIGTTKITFDWKNYYPSVSVSGKEPPAAKQQVDFSLFWDVWNRVEQSYYDKSAIKGTNFVDGAIEGMVQSLGDPYTEYLPPKQNTDFRQGLAGQFGGIGAELGLDDKQIIVVAPLDNTPAKRAGIKSGDAILKVDGKTTFNWTVPQAVEKIRGPKGTSVLLTIMHKNGNKPIDVKLTRETIKIDSVVSWTKNVKEIENVKLSDAIKKANTTIGYIRLSQFGDRTNDEWTEAVNNLSLKSQGANALNGIILDLRNNPGGYLTDASFIASEFLRNGVIVIQEDGNGTRSNLSVERKGLFLDIPLIVLINQGSASASEIVAAALSDHKRARLVGETSFGKGTIQQAQDLQGGGALKVTVAKWLTPNGTWVHEKGITPDVVVALSEKEPTRDTQLEKAIEEIVK